MLERSGEFEVVGQARDGEEAAGMVQEVRPDAVIMDILMPVKNGIEACREIVAALPETRVLMLTASNDQGGIVQLVNAGASGYLQKYSGKEMLLSTVRAVAGGEFRVQGEAAWRLVAGMGGGSAPVPPSELDRLTPGSRRYSACSPRGCPMPR